MKKRESHGEQITSIILIKNKWQTQMKWKKEKFIIFYYVNKHRDLLWEYWSG